MHAAHDSSAVRHTVETLTEEIGRIVAERQDLRAASAGPEALEEIGAGSRTPRAYSRPADRPAPAAAGAA